MVSFKMKGTTSGGEGSAFPRDLAEWVGAVQLIHWSLDEVRNVSVPAGERIWDGETYGQRMLVTLWAYGLARGVRSSSELARRVDADPDFRYVCARQYPDGAILRRARREWSGLILMTLTGVLLRAGRAGLSSVSSEVDAECRANVLFHEAVQADSLEGE